MGRRGSLRLQGLGSLLGGKGSKKGCGDVQLFVQQVPQGQCCPLPQY